VKNKTFWEFQGLILRKLKYSNPKGILLNLEGLDIILFSFFFRFPRMGEHMFVYCEVLEGKLPWVGR
jgi:hypothetical protein